MKFRLPTWNGEALELEETIANKFQPQAWDALAQLLQQGPVRFETAQRARRAEPDHLDVDAAPVVASKGISAGVDAGRDDVDAFARGPARCRVAEIGISRNDCIGGLARSSKST